jgi:hypothetical protein
MSLHKWKSFPLNINIFSWPSCWVVQKKFTRAHNRPQWLCPLVYKLCKITHLTGSRKGPRASLNILETTKIFFLCRELNPR